jgi:hypothetical protein
MKAVQNLRTRGRGIKARKAGGPCRTWPVTTLPTMPGRVAIVLLRPFTRAMVICLPRHDKWGRESMNAHHHLARVRGSVQNVDPITAVGEATQEQREKEDGLSEALARRAGGRAGRERTVAEKALGVPASAVMHARAVMHMAGPKKPGNIPAQPVPEPNKGKSFHTDTVEKSARRVRAVGSRDAVPQPETWLSTPRDPCLCAFTSRRRTCR